MQRDVVRARIEVFAHPAVDVGQVSVRDQRIEQPVTAAGREVVVAEPETV